jgi:hypothetical protein
MKKMTWLRAAPALAVLVGVSSALAADHLDAPTVKMDATTDITDLYTWVNPTSSTVVFVLNVNPLATTASKFSTSAQYVIHTGSSAAFGGAGATPLNIIATFDASQNISLWVGANEYVNGNASATTGLMTADGKVKVFAGLRDDPFYFNLDGFHAAEAAVEAAASSLTFNTAGCPAVDAATSMALVKALSTNPTSSPPGGTAVDYFAGKNVLSIVVEVDKSLVTSGGPIVSAWASTNKAM